MTAEVQRIVSLLASGTELVCALGMGARLVGRSHECDYPEWVTQLPQLSRPTFDVGGSSREIDEQVRARLRAGEPLYVVDEALLAELAPDVVITQTHCEVCAVSPGDLAHGRLPALIRQQVVSLSAGTLESILDGFTAVSRVLGVPEAGADLVASVRERVGRVEAATRSLIRPKLACLEWIEPPFTMGNWGPELAALAGAECVLGHSGSPSATTTWAALSEADPDVIVIAPCGFGLERGLAEMDVIRREVGFAELRAVRAGQVFVADGNRYFHRSSPSLFETPEILAEILHPQSFEPCHQGRAWQPWVP